MNGCVNIVLNAIMKLFKKKDLIQANIKKEINAVFIK